MLFYLIFISFSCHIYFMFILWIHCFMYGVYFIPLIPLNSLCFSLYVVYAASSAGESPDTNCVCRHMSIFGNIFYHSDIQGGPSFLPPSNFPMCQNLLCVAWSCWTSPVLADLWGSDLLLPMIFPDMFPNQISQQIHLFCLPNHHSSPEVTFWQTLCSRGCPTNTFVINSLID